MIVIGGIVVFIVVFIWLIMMILFLSFFRVVRGVFIFLILW